MPDFTILLPPSRRKQPGGNPFAPDMFDYRSSNTFNFFSELNPARRDLIDDLHEAMDGASHAEVASFLDIEENEVEEAIEINEEILDSPLMSALDRYSPGPMYQAMDFANLPTGAQRRMLENGVIFSGLFGLLRPDDLIPNYVVPLTADLPEVGPVADYWREAVSELLNDALEGEFVWDFLNEECYEVWENDHSYQRLVKITFYLEDENEELYEVTDPEELDDLQGQLIGFLVDESASELEDLKDWEHEEWFEIDEDRSELDEETGIHQIALVPGEPPEEDEDEEGEDEEGEEEENGDEDNGDADEDNGGDADEENADEDTDDEDDGED